MSRDYKSQKSATSANSRSALIWGLFIGYILGLISAIGVWMFLSQADSPYLSEDERPAQYSEKSVETRQPVPEEVVEKAAQQDETDPQFDFYEILPGVVEEPSATEGFEQAQKPSPIPTVSPINVSEDYFLQAGSFKKAEDAEDLKARLALLGVVASIQSIDLAEKGRWYRVRIGPFNAMSRVNQVNTSLKQNGIETHFIKVQRSTR